MRNFVYACLRTHQYIFVMLRLFLRRLLNLQTMELNVLNEDACTLHVEVFSSSLYLEGYSPGFTIRDTISTGLS